MADIPDDWNPGAMVEYALKTATETMREDGTFKPFAVTLDSDGEAKGVFPDEVDELDDQSDIFERLVDTLREEAAAGAHAAAALVVDTEIRTSPEGQPHNAILIHEEERGGEAQRTVFLYALAKAPSDGAVVYHLELAGPQVVTADPMIFDAQ